MVIVMNLLITRYQMCLVLLWQNNTSTFDIILNRATSTNMGLVKFVVRKLFKSLMILGCKASCSRESLWETEFIFRESLGIYTIYRSTHATLSVSSKLASCQHVLVWLGCFDYVSVCVFFTISATGVPSSELANDKLITIKNC